MTARTNNDNINNNNNYNNNNDNNNSTGVNDDDHVATYLAQRIYFPSLRQLTLILLNKWK